MKLNTLTLPVLGLFALMACHSNKKATVANTTPASPQANSNTNVAAPPQVYGVEAPVMIPAPGETELSAIQATYKNVSMEDLKQGHFIYTKGACKDCHGPQPISKYSEGEWKNIVLDMAQKAKITDAERDAVYKFVMAVKATEKKGSK